METEEGVMPTRNQQTELAKLKLAYQVALEANTKDPANAYDDTALAVLVGFARMTAILTDLCMITSVCAKEMNSLRMMTAGKIQEAFAEQQEKPIIYKPH